MTPVGTIGGRRGADRNVPARDSANTAQGKQPPRRHRYDHASTFVPEEPAELYRKLPQTTTLCYKAEAIFNYAAFFLVRDDFLEWDDGTNMTTTLACINRSYNEMTRNVLELRSYDFSWLRNERVGYNEQEEIDPERVKAMTALAIYYGMDFGLVVRWLGGEYTGEWRDTDAILRAAAPVVAPSVLDHMRRILTVGAPARFNWEEPAWNKQAFISRGNNPSVARHIGATRKTINKEERNSTILPFLGFAVLFSAFGHIVPQHLRVDSEKSRLIWNGKAKAYHWERTMNEMTDMHDEMPITFGYVYMNFCTWLWNMRITYPNEDILLAFLDITAAFRFPRVFADLVGAFGFMIGPLYFAANAMVFGSVASASSWEPFRVAIAALATALFWRATDFAAAHQWLMDKVTWEPEPEDGTVQFKQARRCSKNDGVVDETGRRVPTSHNIYVDDNLIGEVRRYMPSALLAAVEAIFTIMGRPEPERRQVAVSLEKWSKLHVHWKQVLLGLEWNTRLMTVGIDAAYRRKVLDLLTKTWHAGREAFDVMEMEKLVGTLGRVAQAFRPLYHLMPHLYSSVAYALRENERFLMSTSRRFRQMMKTAKTRVFSSTEEDEREINFAIGQAARAVHACDNRYRMPQSLKEEIAYVTQIIADESVELTTPIAQIVDRDPDFDIAGDACPESGGGWSTDLRLWWFIAFETEVVRRARLVRDKTRISINVLETVVAIINLAAVIYACHVDGIDISDHPVLRNWCDNMAATCWINNRCRDSLIGRRLGRLFCGLLMSTPLGIQVEWLPTGANEIADSISRVKRAGRDYDFSQLFADYPSLANCRQFQPSDFLLGMISDVLLRNASPEPLILRQLKPQTLGSFIS